MTGQLIITYPRVIVGDTKKHPSHRGTEVARAAREIQYPICVSPNDAVERAVQGETRKTAHDWTRAKLENKNPQFAFVNAIDIFTSALCRIGAAKNRDVTSADVIPVNAFVVRERIAGFGPSLVHIRSLPADSKSRERRVSSRKASTL